MLELNQRFVKHDLKREGIKPIPGRILLSPNVSHCHNLIFADLD
jgi:hypothetical protein